MAKVINQEQLFEISVMGAGCTILKGYKAATQVVSASPSPLSSSAVTGGSRSSAKRLLSNALGGGSASNGLPLNTVSGNKTGSNIILGQKQFKSTMSPTSTSNHTAISRRPLVVCGPSGSGKSTILARLMKEYPDSFGFSVSHTTRKPRDGEVDGRDYHFIDRKSMEQNIANGDMIEYTEFAGNIYGTSKRAVKQVQDSGRICILDVEIEGVKNLKKTDLNPLFVFIKPPSMQILESRLRGRGTETEEKIKVRLDRAREELKYGETTGNFDLTIVNDDIDEAYKKLRQFILPEIEGARKAKENH